MYYEGTYKVESVTRTTDGEVFEATQHVRRGLGKYYRVSEMPVPDNVDVEPSDVVTLRIENHSDESGHGNGSWALDRFVGFPYDKERGWSPLDGLGSGPELYDWNCTECGKEHQFPDDEPPKECLNCHACLTLDE